MGKEDKNAVVRETIIDVTKDLFSERTYSDISLADIQKAAKVSKGAIYWYFSSKEDLFEQVFLDCYNRSYARIHPTDFTGGAAQILKTRLKAMVEADQADHRDYDIIQKYMEYKTSIGQAIYPYGGFKEDVEIIVQKGMEEGIFVQLPEDLLMSMLLGMNSSIVMFFRKHSELAGDPGRLESIIDIALSTLLRQEKETKTTSL